ncbi:MAG TPA: hypothetical protein VKG45_05580 [Actinomycetes bacterium]|nr:hypothetical protein [Actinomycetes bacterium]
MVVRQPRAGTDGGTGGVVRAASLVAASVLRALAAVLLLCSVLLIVALVGEGVAGAEGRPSGSGPPQAGAWGKAWGKASDLYHWVLPGKPAAAAPPGARGGVPGAPGRHGGTAPELGTSLPVRGREPRFAAPGGEGDPGDPVATGGGEGDGVPAAPVSAPGVRQRRGEVVLFRDLARDRIQAIRSEADHVLGGLDRLRLEPSEGSMVEQAASLGINGTDAAVRIVRNALETGTTEFLKGVSTADQLLLWRALEMEFGSSRPALERTESAYRALVEFPDPQGFAARPTHLALNTWDLMAAVVGAGLAVGLGRVGGEELLGIDTDRMYRERMGQIPQAWLRMGQDAAVIGAAAKGAVVGAIRRSLTGPAGDDQAASPYRDGTVPATPARPGAALVPPAASPTAADRASAADKGASLRPPVDEPVVPVPAAGERIATAPAAPAPGLAAETGGDQDFNPLGNDVSSSLPSGRTEQGTALRGLPTEFDNSPVPPPPASDLEPASGVEVVSSGVPDSAALDHGAGGAGGGPAVDAVDASAAATQT